MIVHVIRHGETEHNVKAEAHQTYNTPLTAKGKAQAISLKKKFASIPLEVIITSPLDRAKQTAKQIALAKTVQLEENILLRERKQPSEIEGKRYDDPEAKRIKQKIESHQHDPHYRYSDEEHFEDIKHRALLFIQQLEERKEEHIAVVSHRHFIRMLLGVMAMKQEYSLPMYQAYDAYMYNNNASVTVCEFNHHTWRLISFDDTSHLVT